MFAPPEDEPFLFLTNSSCNDHIIYRIYHNIVITMKFSSIFIHVGDTLWVWKTLWCHAQARLVCLSTTVIQTTERRATQPESLTMHTVNWLLFGYLNKWHLIIVQRCTVGCFLLHSTHIIEPSLVVQTTGSTGVKIAQKKPLQYWSFNHLICPCSL